MSETKNSSSHTKNSSSHTSHTKNSSSHTKNSSHSRSRHQSTESNCSSDNDSTSSDTSLLSLPPAPDGGWGWAVVLAAFFLSMICDGCAFSFGILYAELLDAFGESKSKTSLVGSLFVGVPLICGPLASALVNRFGCRKMTIFGGFVSSAGLILSYFGNSIEMLCFTFGIISGIGMSFCYVTTVVIVAFYFEQKRALATGLAVCGSGIGTFVFAPLMKYLINEYGWRGALLILGGLVLNIIVCGAVFRPLKFTRAERRRRALHQFDKLPRSLSRQSLPSRGRSRYSSEVTTHSGSSEEDHKDNQQELEKISRSQVQLPTYVNSDEVIEIPPAVLAMYRKNGSSYQQTVQRFFHDLTFAPADDQAKTTEMLTLTSDDQIVFLDEETQLKASNDDAQTSNHHSPHANGVWQRKLPGITRPKQMVEYLPLFRKDIFYRGNILKLAGSHYRTSSCPELYTSSFDYYDDDEEDDIFDSCPIFRIMRLSKQAKRLMRTMFDVKILGHPLFLLFAISNFILYFWYDVPYVFMVDFAIELGFTEGKASFIISIIGIINTVGQVLYGYIGDLDVNLTLLYSVSCMLSGVCVLLVPLLPVYWYMCTLAGCFGFFISSNYSLTTVMLVDFLGLDKLTNACGLLMLSQGIANLIGPPVAGWMSDNTGNYNATFYGAGIFIVVAGALVLVMMCMKKVKRQSSSDAHVIKVNTTRHVQIRDPEIEPEVVERESVL